jgi:shikimate dehydrogenase
MRSKRWAQMCTKLRPETIVKLDEKVYALGLTGFPLGHSLSPELQRASLAKAGLAGDYRLYPVPPGDVVSLKVLVDRLRSRDLHGLNVTIPHKQTVMALVDELTEEAEAIGAVNCLYLRNGRVIGDNTDAAGFLTDLERLLPSRGLAHTLVLGAGGSARAVVYALARSGRPVTVAARRPEQAAELAGRLGGFLPQARIAAVELTPECLAATPPVDLIVNTTPLGMHPKVEGCAWPEELAFPPGAAVYDLVYNPPETVLVKRARAVGLPAFTGLGMLVEQANRSFELWVGR